MKKGSKRFIAMLTAATTAFTALPAVSPAMNVFAVEAGEASISAPKEGYSLVWNDEFSGDTLNRADWNVELHDPGWVNSELQSYVDSTDNIYLNDGKLYITAQKNVAEDGTVSYTSGRLNTQNKHDFTYGYYEVRAQVPEGMGYLPAFWLMASDENVYGQWPRCGEIDAMEVMGQDPEKLYGTIHYGNPHRESQGTYSLEDATFADSFHTFAVDWEPGKITWYVDGVKYHEEDDWYSTTVGQGTVTYPAPFDQPFYMILNLAVGGSWVGNPDETTSFDNNPFVIDYVRVFQKDSYDENVSRPTKEVVLRNPAADGNYITADDWTFLTALGGEGAAAINDEIVISTTNEGTVDYSVQLVQANVPFEKGATYEVSFDAYADASRTMKTAIKAPDYGYVEYMTSKDVSLTTESQNFTYSFKMKDSSDANGRLEFNMGAAGSTATIHIANVSVKKTAEPDPTEVEPKTILADGNYVYNGKFQEGANHLGEWTLEGTAAASVTALSDGRRLCVVAGAEDTLTLSQSDLALKAGNAYAFSFDAQADADCQITATVGRNDFTADVTTEKKTFSFVIPSTAELADKDISFDLAVGTTLYLDNVAIVENAMIKNGSFNAGTSGYEIYIDSSASASYVVDSLTEDNALDFTVNNTGSDDWKIQVKQNNVCLENGKWYRLTFSAKSSRERKIRAIMQGDEAHGWPAYSGENIVSLTNDFQTFTKDFKMTSATDEGAFLSICLGKVEEVITEQHRVVIDDISLVEIEAPEEEEVIANTNLLQNADFSDEENAMAHWSETIANWGPEDTTDATRTIADGKIIYDIKNPGELDWHVQLKQAEISFKAGETYRVSFKIDTTVARNFKTGVMNSAYKWYGGTDTLIPAGTTEITYEFTMPKDDFADFYISLGKFSATDDTPASVVTISDLSLILVKEEAEEPEEDAQEANTNLLANADFSDEENAMAAWTETIANWGPEYSTDATRTIADSAITYDIKDAGAADWHIQLKQEGLTFEAGETYRASYDIYTSVARNIKSGVQTPDYKWLGGYDGPIKAGKQTIVYEFTVTEKKTGDFYISLGKFSDTENTPASVVRISNMVLIKTDENTDDECPVERHVHKAGKAVVENKVAPTKTKAGHYDLVTRCSDSTCKAVMSKKTVITYMITYVLNGGKNNAKNKSIYEYGQISSLAAPSRVGYRFDGWYKDAKFKTKLPSLKTNKSSITVYAKWTKLSLAKGNITKATNTKGKKLALTWKKVTGATSYQIFVSTSKNMKNAKVYTTTATSKTLTGLKKTTYYIQVRALAKDSAGKYVYGAKSSVKKVKIKK